jgi:excisionase family DNA binding protein
MKQLLTAEQVATSLSVDKATVYRWARSGRLPAYQLGPGVVRFDPDLLADWLSGQLVGTPTPQSPRMPHRSGRVRRSDQRR